MQSTQDKKPEIAVSSPSASSSPAEQYEPVSTPDISPKKSILQHFTEALTPADETAPKPDTQPPVAQAMFNPAVNETKHDNLVDFKRKFRLLGAQTPHHLAEHVRKAIAEKSFQICEWLLRKFSREIFSTQPGFTTELYHLLQADLSPNLDHKLCLKTLLLCHQEIYPHTPIESNSLGANLSRSNVIKARTLFGGYTALVLASQYENKLSPVSPPPQKKT